MTLQTFTKVCTLSYSEGVDSKSSVECLYALAKFIGRRRVSIELILALLKHII